MEAIRNLVEEIDTTPTIFNYENWMRYLFGYKGSPFCVIKSYFHAEEAIVGDPKRSNSPVRWDRVVLNCIGDPNFDPRRPFLYRWDDTRKCIAGAVTTYTDDGRGSGKDEEHTWQVSRLYTTRLQFFGIQNASRKTRPPTNVNPGAWAGAITSASDDSITKSVAQSKWEKCQNILSRIADEIKNSTDGCLQFKKLERE